MADITIDDSIDTATANAMRALVYVTETVGYMFFIEVTTSFLRYAKTTDGGASWGGVTTLSGVVTRAIDVWFDKWTSGNSGTTIHVFSIDGTAHDVKYDSLDTAADTIGTTRVVFAGASAVAGIGLFVSGTRARGGNLECVYNMDDGTESGLYRSIDAGVNWTIRTNPIEAASDWAMLFPGNESDNQDVWMLYLDASADELSLKVHADAADSNAEAAIMPVIENTTNLTGQYPFSGSVRHSDGHLIVAAWSARDSATGDFRTFDITSAAAITELTALATDKDDSYYPGVHIDQSTNAIYVAYIGKLDGSETLDSAAGVYYAKSTDGGTTWIKDLPYSAAVSDWRNLWTPPSGPRFAVAWRDISAVDLVTNVDNSIAGADPSSFSFEKGGPGMRRRGIKLG
jgi:hypothetical protein